MRGTPQVNHVRVQTNVLPAELSTAEIYEAARSISLFYKNANFVCQTFFTNPLVGELNWVDGLEKQADVHFREIRFIGPNLFHIRVVGTEDNVRRMCEDPKFYNLLKGLYTTFNEEIRSRRYLEVTDGRERWDVIYSLDKKTYYLANQVSLNGQKTRIRNIIVVGDRLLGLTDNKEVVIGHLTPEIIEQKERLLEVSLMPEVNELGKVDLLETMPNSEDCFLVSIGNTVYQFDIWGNRFLFDTLDGNVKRINAISFNHTRSIMATDSGLYEVDVMEMPNMAKPSGLPRLIANDELKKEFQTALYVEDPYLLGIHPAVGVFAKTRDEKVVFF
ncbi:MAG: hypothetical protein D6715_02725 [Calditrichaeota bacterium]|nr:MAG: hypothetical protein D6715_02725 [Calditrichota bacterium]